ncbi:hypothetical protein EU528_08655 [Candidatus Thorarchaeota archaeon]|nr:MAG: hypothetical protein EU528_08655 [Candidatus Thorarchaeota archaeon]
MNGMDCVRLLAEEILRGRILRLSEPLSYPGIAIVPIVRLGVDSHREIHSEMMERLEGTQKIIIGSLPRNTCGVFILDSLGDILAFKFHLDIGSFWKRIRFVERLIVEEYKDTRKPLSKISASSLAVAFLIRLKMRGPDGIMNSKSDYFAVSRTDLEGHCESADLLTLASAVLYCAVSQ